MGMVVPPLPPDALVFAFLGGREEVASLTVRSLDMESALGRRLARLLATGCALILCREGAKHYIFFVDVFDHVTRGGL